MRILKIPKSKTFRSDKILSHLKFRRINFCENICRKFCHDHIFVVHLHVCYKKLVYKKRVQGRSEN